MEIKKKSTRQQPCIYLAKEDVALMGQAQSARTSPQRMSVGTLSLPGNRRMCLTSQPHVIISPRQLLVYADR